MIMKNVLNNWMNNLIIIKPETVIRWHRKSFSEYLKKQSKNDAGRPSVSKEQIDLIKRIANENPMCGVALIHGEILKLGYIISQAIVWRYTPKDKIILLDNVGRPFLKIMHQKLCQSIFSVFQQ
jgi:hypothetical protein